MFNKVVYIVIGVVLLVGVIHTYRLNSSLAAEQESRRQLEASLLTSKDLIVATEASRSSLAEQLDSLIRENSELGLRIAQAQKTAPNAKPIVIIQTKTESSPVIAAPIQGDSKTCVLYQNDEGHIETSEVVLKTEATNHILVGTSYAIRDSDKAKLFGGSFKTDVSKYFQLRPEVSPDTKRYAFGVAASLTDSKFGLGVIGRYQRNPVEVVGALTVDKQLTPTAIAGIMLAI